METIKGNSFGNIYISYSTNWPGGLNQFSFSEKGLCPIAFQTMCFVLNIMEGNGRS